MNGTEGGSEGVINHLNSPQFSQLAGQTDVDMCIGFKDNGMDRWTDGPTCLEEKTKEQSKNKNKSSRKRRTRLFSRRKRQLS